MDLDLDSLSACGQSGPFAALALENLGPSLLAPMPTRTLPKARVVWLNIRWFAERGVSLTCPATAEAVRRQLLQRFAVEVEPSAPTSEAVFGADRYGASAGSVLGGSGRCAVSGAFNVKGIGRTPLALEQIDWDHRHGYLWLPEALREAICSEVANAELPWGGIASVAIIDVGETVEDPDDPRPNLFRRRALIVRPNFVRPAHFERSLYFGSAGTKDSEQFIDAQRTRQAIEVASRAAANAGGLLAAIDQMVLRYAGQLGAARANKLWSGRFMSSNVAISGALADFGIFRAVPSWQGLTGVPGERMGQDLAHLATAVRSLYYYASKYGPRPQAEGRGAEALIALAGAEIEAIFEKTLWVGLGMDAPAHATLRARVAPLLRRFYMQQQKSVLRANSLEAEAAPCLYEALAEEGCGVAPLDVLGRAIIAAVAEHNATWPAQPLHLANLRRWLAPRRHLYYVALTQRAELAAREIVAAGPEGEVVASAFIDKMIGLSRRTWRLLPTGHRICGVGYRAGSAAVYVEAPKGERGVWIECPAADGVPYPFGRPLPEALRARIIFDGDQRAMLFAPLGAGDPPSDAVIASQAMNLPMPLV